MVPVVLLVVVSVVVLVVLVVLMVVVVVVVVLGLLVGNAGVKRGQVSGLRCQWIESCGDCTWCRRDCGVGR